jgi:predicted transcriptional regulator
MTVLDDDRHERFAQGVVKGLTNGQAYLEAGFKSSNLSSASSQAHKMVKKHPEITDRISELQDEARRIILDKHFSGSVEELAKLLLDDREFARQQKQAGAAVSASAQLMKLFEKGAENVKGQHFITEIKRTIVSPDD